MLLVATVLIGALIAGWIAGGRLRNLGHVELRGKLLVIAAVGFQLVLGIVSLAGGPVDLVGRPLLAVSHVALLVFILANRLLPGMALVFIGFALNAVVVSANGAMPVSGEALQALGGEAAVDPGKHQLLEDDHVLPWLADVIPVPVLRTVVSVGDVVLAAGVAVLVPSLMRRYPPAPGRRRRSRPVPIRGARDDAS